MALIQCPECKREISSSARSCPSCGYPMQENSSEPQFEAFRKRVLIGSLVMCIVTFPIGIALNIPYVWGLCIAGIIVAGVKLAVSAKRP